MHRHGAGEVKRKAILLAAVLASFVFLAGLGRNGDSVYVSHDNSQMKIALTFDDGPHETLTPEILDILAEYGAKATFFLVGENAEAHPELVIRETVEGHEIGNHTYSHVVLKKDDTASAIEELKSTESVLYAIGEYRPKYVRPPCGVYDSTVIETVKSLGCKVVLWNIDTRDWAHTPSEDIIEMLLSTVKSGDIILCHDYITGYSPTPEVLRAVIPALMKQGYSFVTVSELIGSE